MKDIPKQKMDDYVKSSKNVFFKKVDTILMGGDYANKFMVDFLKFVLKFDMPEKIRIFLEEYADREKVFESILMNKLEGFYSDLGWTLNLNPYINQFFEL